LDALSCFEVLNLKRLLAGLLLLALCWPSFAQDTAVPIPNELVDYIKKKDDAYSWKLLSEEEVIGGATIYYLEMISQEWQGIKWDHGLQVIIPKGVKPRSTMMIWNQGGTPSKTSGILAAQIADRVKAPVAFLYGIPKQPLFGGKKEDALIAETFVKYLETKDPSWPLLFPMAKSLVKTMDTIQAFAKQQWKFEVTHFVVTGASKRGWTSWLTAASGDPRVKAIAPLVIDTLNFKLQMPNQLKSFGKFSEMIHDYEERKLLPLPDTAEAKKLWSMVDPWVYREKLTLPKMIINGTNDPYWSQDALNIYWDDLKGPKFISYVPNAGHDLRPMDKPNQPDAKRELIPIQAINAMAIFTRHMMDDKPMPKQTWSWTEGEAGVKLSIQTDGKIKEANFWKTTSTTRDFRKSKWEKVSASPGELSTTVKGTAGEFTAFFGEVIYEYDGIPFTLSTQIKILEPKK
jgi:PhoPQ-activated pathogenicity-related protein